MWTSEHRAEYMRQWREKNKNRIKEYRRKKYMQSLLDRTFTPPPTAESTEYMRSWRERNIERYREYQREYQRKYRAKNKA